MVLSGVGGSRRRRDMDVGLDDKTRTKIMAIRRSGGIIKQSWRMDIGERCKYGTIWAQSC